MRNVLLLALVSLPGAASFADEPILPPVIPAFSGEARPDPKGELIPPPVIPASAVEVKAPELVPPPVIPVQAVEAVPGEPSTTAILVDGPIVTPQWTLTAEIGGGWGGLSGRLRPPAGSRLFRPALFPVPRAELDGFFNPRVAIGYELFTAPGELTLSWQSITSSGEAILLGYDPLAAMFLGYMKKARDKDERGLVPALAMRASPSTNAILTSRVDAQLVDLTYAHEVWRDTRGIGSGPSLKVKLGGRLGTFFNDDRAISVGYDQWVSNYFLGAGPIVGLRGDVPGLGERAGERQGRLYLGVDGGVLFGEATQRFRETDLYAPVAYRETAVTADQSVPFLSVEVGSTSHFGVEDRFGTTFGFRYSQFWNVGSVGPSNLDLNAFTLFVGCQFKF